MARQYIAKAEMNEVYIRGSSQRLLMQIRYSELKPILRAAISGVVVLFSHGSSLYSNDRKSNKSGHYRP